MQHFFDLKITLHSPQNNNLLKLSITNTRYGRQALCLVLVYGTQSQIGIKI